MRGSDHLQYPLPGPELEHFKRGLPVAQRQAIEIRKEGYHHSGFLVGAAGIGITSSGPRLFYGSNYKPKKGDFGPRVCAEHDMHMHAEYRGCTHLLGFSIAAFYQADDASGGDLDGCLLPCIHCRVMFAESLHVGGIFQENTVCMSMRLEQDGDRVRVAHQAWATVGEILREYPVVDP